MKFEVIVDIVGKNEAGETCHPFKGVRGEKKGFFSYTFLSDNKSFVPTTESELRKKIEAGEFNSRGRIRMIPPGAKSTTGAGALSLVSYKGKKVPI